MKFKLDHIARCKFCGPYSHPNCSNVAHRQQAWLQFCDGVMPSKQECKEMATYIDLSWLKVSRSSYRNQGEIN